MMTVVATVHIIICLLLIAMVLLQDPKSSGGGGGMFGGGSANSLLGATGGATFLTQLTRYSAIIFGITCLVLTLLSRPEQGSVLDSVTSPKSTMPTAPFEKPASTGATETGATAPGQTGVAAPNAVPNGKGATAAPAAPAPAPAQDNKAPAAPKKK